jgi:hypothetical protein
VHYFAIWCSSACDLSGAAFRGTVFHPSKEALWGKFVACAKFQAARMQALSLWGGKDSVA